ncbi:MAG: heparinase II/III family protein, partial [Candidatus Hydrogenedentes bacterium]|nr:heparinase II/III family protein [Candidatus Hydrogenedentota bacterium]
QYTPGAGHNVLQLGTAEPEGPADAGELVCLPGWQRSGAVAPITVDRLDAAGGDVSVDVSAGYDRLERWRRRVTWTADALRVVDDVALAEPDTDIVLFRWHLGTDVEVSIAGSGREFVVAWPEASLTIEGSAPLTVSQCPWPDNTVSCTGGREPLHTCLVVRSTNPERGLNLTTTVTAK